MDRWVALFRNVYNGRPNNPDARQLEEAFLASGATFAKSFLANGTVIFDLPGSIELASVQSSASAHLEQACGLKEPAMYRALSDFSRWKEERPFQSVEHDSNVHDRLVCFLAEPILPAPELPIVTHRGDCKVLSLDGPNAFAVTYMIAGRGGYPTQVLEARHGCVATTRNWRTVERIVAKFS